MNRAELLAPAGNPERLQTALRYGADAVYLGAQRMSLRNFADNFSPQALFAACTQAHALGKKVYVACNAFARDEELAELPALLRELCDAGADALIVNDPGVIRIAKRVLPRMPLHLSTQANTLNTEAALFWHELGVARIILARELSLAQIARMRAKLPDTLELEMFVHGAMCVSYSGRCLLSNYLDGRDSNRGECVQPCRWAYELRERGKDGLYYTLEQDETGSYVFNARDLNLIDHLREILDAGISSLKLEGRMKSIAYVATVTNAYRMALDALYAGQPPDARLRAELEHASHRPYWTGFAFGDPGTAGQATQNAQYQSDMDIAAVVTAYDAQARIAAVEQRNRFFDGDTLHILSPGDIGRSFCVQGIADAEGNQMQSAPHPREKLLIGCAEPVLPGDMLRRAKETK